MRYRWTLAPEQPLLSVPLSTALGISPLLAQCLINRGLDEVATAEPYLAPRLKRLADPFLLPNMDAAIGRLIRAIRQEETIVVFGDYDVDGVTSTALMVEVLRFLRATVLWYLPHRLEEGYGLTQDAVENCVRQSRPSLLVAVDCGSTAFQPVHWLKANGIDAVVVDHHQPSDPLPEAVAIVNPMLAVPGMPSFRELCSAGLAFKVAHALAKRGREEQLPGANDIDLKQWLDLVALGTIADLVPLRGENRILVTEGLRRLNTTPRPGIVALKSVARVPDPINVHGVAFLLAPRLNAAGRLETAERALHLILAADLDEATPIAHELDSQNRERQQIEQNMFDQVMASVRSSLSEESFVIVQGELLWHIGVVGIVASRILRQFYRPTIILGGDGEEWRGSGRSIEGFDLASALRDCGDLLLRHGGHAMAAGLSIHPDKVPEFRQRLDSLARRQLSADSLTPCLRLDGVAALADLNLKTLDEFSLLEPTGQGNPHVQLIIPNLRHHRPPERIGKDQQHFKCRVTDGSTSCDAIRWNGAELACPEAPFDLAVVPQVNTFNGRSRVQLKILDWRPSSRF